MDWNKIKAEYIAGGTSYRKLAKKYGVSFSTLRGKAEREKWTELKAQAQHKTDTNLVETIGEQNGTYTVKVSEVADKLLNRINDLIDLEGYVGVQSIKQLTSALKDIKDIKCIKSDADIREQEARIRKLQKDAEDKNQDNRIIVSFEEEVMKYGD